MSFLYKIKIDIDNYLPQKIVVRSRQGDKGSHTIHAEIYQNNQRLNLTGYQAQFSSENANGNKTFSNCEIVNNEIVHTLTSGYEKTDGSWALGELDIPGDLNCEFIVTSNTNTFTTPAFRIIVDSVIHDSSAIVASDNFDALTVVLAKLDDEITGLASKASITQLNTEKSAREAADTTLTNAIAAEKSARETKDTELTNAIATEKAAREAKDTELGNAISTEESARTSGDSALSTSIAALNGETLKYAKRGTTTIKSKVDSMASDISDIDDRSVENAEDIVLHGTRLTNLETDNATNKSNIAQIQSNITDINTAKASVTYVNNKDAEMLSTSKTYTDTEAAKKQDTIVSGYDTKVFGWVTGCVSNTTGKIKSVTNYSTTNYIRVPLTSLGDGSMSYFLYNSAENTYAHFYSDLPTTEEEAGTYFVTSSSVKLSRGTNKLSIPETAKYVRFSIANTSMDSFRVMPYDMSSGSGESEIFWCTYNETTYDEITEAISQSKVPMFWKDSVLYKYELKSGNMHRFASTYDIVNRRYKVYLNANGRTDWTYEALMYENSGNKATNFSTINDAKYPTTKAVVDYINSLDAREVTY